MRIALAGLGSASVRGHLPAIARLASERRLTLVGAADPDAGRRAATAPQLSGAALFDSTEAMLESTRSDVLVVACEPGAHAGLAELAALHRQHLVCEKPLTLTRQHQDEVASAYSDPALALVPVHQYQYSPAWISLARWGRAATRLGVPFELRVRVERKGTDRHAATAWRSDLSRSGGVLADHGVHFLALGWTISEDLEILSAARSWDAGRGERSLARLRLGSGRLEVDISAAADARHTRVTMQAARLAFDWTDDRAALRAGSRFIRDWRTYALSDRDHVDALYAPFYRNLVANLRDRAWRMRRTAEALSVSTALITLLERLEADGATE